MNRAISLLRLRMAGIRAEYSVECSPRTSIRSGTGVVVESGSVLQGSFTFGDGVKIGRGSTLLGRIRIGRRSNINGFADLDGDISIGSYCAIAKHVSLHERNHASQLGAIQIDFVNAVTGKPYPHETKGTIRLGSDVWMGTRSVVLSGVHVGHGAIIGAGAVVTRDVDPYSVVGGVPARHLRWRFPRRIIDDLLEIRWWDWDDERITSNATLFTANLAKVSSVWSLVRPETRHG